jgi:hypothetical protein
LNASTVSRKAFPWQAANSPASKFFARFYKFSYGILAANGTR